MVIEKNISKYIVYYEDSIVNALKKISDNKDRFITIVNEFGILQSILTDGDFRRWITSAEIIDLNQPVSNIGKKDFKYIYQNKIKDAEFIINSDISFLPVVDEQKHLVSIIKKGGNAVTIDYKVIDEHSPSFIIAEIGNNHNGSIDLAKKLVDLAVQSGADCAKFQMRDLKALYSNAGNADDASEDLGSQYTLDLLSRFQLTTSEMIEVFDYCKEQGIIPLCTPWDISSLNILEEYGMPAYKLASADLTNHELLRAMARTGKPLICSTGMSRESEIIQAVKLLKEESSQYILLHCNSTYPAPFKDVQLNYLKRLKEIGESSIVGYSGHERGINVAIAAVSLGAKVIEKHFTIDREMEGNDHKVSLLPNEFESMVNAIREVELALGNSVERSLSQGELINRENLAKSIVINCDINEGDIIEEYMLEIKSPGKGLQPNRIQEVIGKKANRNFIAGDFIYESDIIEQPVRARKYSFPLKWGVPVRYHDFKKIISQTNPEILEFHLSYKDLDLNIEDFFDKVYDMGLVVHTPELFAGDHLLDLCALDESYRLKSIQELQRVINITRQLKRYFKRSERPCIVTNMGGFTKDAPMKISEREKYYRLIEDSLSKLDMEGVEIIPQTMPPFPWHFGGQRYQNLFMDPEDTMDFCMKNNMRICFDTSHSKLACNHYKWSFSKFIKQIVPFTAHFHIVDAIGVDGEGLQIGEGDIDFEELANEMKKCDSSISFIPEIWQGHKNNGEGFWIALDKLEEAFDMKKALI